MTGGMTEQKKRETVCENLQFHKLYPVATFSTLITCAGWPKGWPVVSAWQLWQDGALHSIGTLSLIPGYMSPGVIFSTTDPSFHFGYRDLVQNTGTRVFT